MGEGVLSGVQGVMTRHYKRTNVNILSNILLQLTVVLDAFTKKKLLVCTKMRYSYTSVHT
jgi:hypothetical protein